MGTLKNKTLSFPAKMFKQAFAALGIMVALVGCGPGGGGGSAVPLVGLNGCTDCAGITSPVALTTFNAKYTPLFIGGEFSLQNMIIYGQSSSLMPNASGNNYKWYQGPIAMQGTLVVPTAFTAGNCVIPAGSYALQTYSVGKMDYQGVNISVPALMTTSGGIELRIEAPSPMGLLDEGHTLWATVSFTRVNGYVCSQNFFDVLK